MSERRDDPPRTEVESRVAACYSTWGERYFDEYYGEGAPYPPVHVDLVKRVLAEADPRTILDAGCGPASFLRSLFDLDCELYGFDLTPEMVVEAQRIFSGAGLSPDRIWRGSVLDAADFRPPGGVPEAFDAAVCIGVLPHVAPESDELVLANLRQAVRPGGTVIVEARNLLFGLFTFNRYSYELLLDELIRAPELLRRAAADEQKPLADALAELRRFVDVEVPPIRKGKAAEPGYDEVLSRLHNPLVLREQFAAAGFEDVRLLHYHFHALPPRLAQFVPSLFERESHALEADPADWRGMFMASAFVLVGRRA